MIKHIKNYPQKLEFISMLALIIGFTSRFYLVNRLPLWHDEIYSIMASRAPIAKIISGDADPVHTPGYYLFLKPITTITNDKIILRLTSILSFCINYLLLFILGKKVSKNYSLLLPTLYALSGYFITLEWQIRMYPTTLTFILYSIYLMQKKKKEKLALIQILGLYFDYSYYWYYIPYLFYNLTDKKSDAYSRKLAIFPIFALVVLYPQLFLNLNKATEGIIWAQNHILPNIFIPFFLGTHKFQSITLLSIILASIGFLKTKTKTINTTLINYALFSFLLTYLVSLTITPIFHIRSLQIIPLVFLILIANGLNYLYDHYKNIVYLIIFLYSLIPLFIISDILSNSHIYLIILDKF